MNTIGAIFWFVMLAIVMEVCMKRRRQFPHDAFWHLGLIMVTGVMIVSMIVAIGSFAGLPR
jgi:hypothetical protein